MSFFLTGILAFVPLFLYDYYKMKAPKGRFGWLFVLGCLLLAGSALGRVMMLDTAGAWQAARGVKSLWAVLFVLSLAALLYTLFIALPPKTYTGAGQEGELRHDGVYGICRHPGFWPFAGCWLFLWLFYGDGVLLAMGAAQTVLNLLYIWWQDRWIFPLALPGYERYRTQVPFLIPRMRVVRFERAQRPR